MVFRGYKMLIKV